MRSLKITALLLLIKTPLLASSPSEIYQSIYSLAQQDNALKKELWITNNDPTLEHKLAKTEGRLIEKYITYNTYMYLRHQGVHRNINQIQIMVDSAFDCSLIFTNLGDTQQERFERILGWAYTETNFKKQCVSIWKKGQYIRSLGITISYDSTDYGAWQINNVDDLPLKNKLYHLYRTGFIPFQINKIRQPEDLFDIPTNCAFRCFVETERRKNGMPWKHDKAKRFLRFLNDQIYNVQLNGYYDQDILQGFYYHR